MKASEFVKKFGWEDSKTCLLNCASPEDKWFMRQGELICDQDFDDLKRIVESYELVESYGGINGARKELANFCGNLIDCAYLCQAIAAVESCQ